MMRTIHVVTMALALASSGPAYARPVRQDSIDLIQTRYESAFRSARSANLGDIPDVALVRFVDPSRIDHITVGPKLTAPALERTCGLSDLAEQFGGVLSVATLKNRVGEVAKRLSHMASGPRLADSSRVEGSAGIGTQLKLRLTQS